MLHFKPLGHPSSEKESHGTKAIANDLSIYEISIWVIEQISNNSDLCNRPSLSRGRLSKSLETGSPSDSVESGTRLPGVKAPEVKTHIEVQEVIARALV